VNFSPTSIVDANINDTYIESRIEYLIKPLLFSYLIHGNADLFDLASHWWIDLGDLDGGFIDGSEFAKQSVEYPGTDMFEQE